MRNLLELLKKILLELKSLTSAIAAINARKLYDADDFRYQAGYTGTLTVPANSYVDKAITFPVPFTTVPQISLTLVSSSTAGAIGSITPCVKGSSETKTGFVIRVFNAGSSQRAPGVLWEAKQVTAPAAGGGYFLTRLKSIYKGGVCYA